MNTKIIKKSGGWVWRRPIMTVQGQIAFWNNQAGTYATTDMTNDNELEMNVVQEKCREINYSDIVTLGGAVGCRDPKMILDDLRMKRPSARPAIIFNDLSPKQVREAKASALKPFAKSGYHVTCHAGEIKKVCAKIAPKPRRLLIGVYDLRSFFTAHKKQKHPKCGFDEYVDDSHILGERFLMDWVTQNDRHQLVFGEFPSERIDSKGDKRYRAISKRRLSNVWHQITKGRVANITALEVVGWSEGRDGFFLSHWYTPQGILRMLEVAFPPKHFTTIATRVAKGTVFCIDPRHETPTGVVTVLNNVIGNVLPHDQYLTLCAIRRIVRPL